MSKQDLEYLFSDSVGKVISEGLTILYEKHPQQPVTYLANWLLNHCNEQTNVSRAIDAEKLAVELKAKLAEKLKEEEKAERMKQVMANHEANLEKAFREKLANHLYLEEFLDQELPDHILDRKNFPGVYIGFVTYPYRRITDDEDDPEAHLDKERGEVILYVGASREQRFLIEKMLLPETGVTYDVFKPPEENIDGETPPEKPQTKYIPDVTQEKNLVYFKIPKLGAYYAVSLAYKSVLNENAFDEGVKERIRVTEERRAQAEEKEKEEENYLQQLDDADEKDRPAIEEAWKNRVWDPIEEKEPEFILKKYVLGVDTMGEDREITPEEREYLKQLGGFFVDCWEKSEKNQLSQAIDLQIKATADFVKEDFLEGLNGRVEEEVNERVGSDDVPENDTELAAKYRRAVHTAEVYKTILLEQEYKDKIMYLKQYRVIKFWQVIQEALILAGYTRQEINFPGSNLLDWKVSRHLLNEEKFFEPLANYQIKGPKSVKPPKYATVNRILKRARNLNPEDIDPYNTGLGILLRFIVATLEARLLDIEFRKETISLARVRIAQLTEEENQRVIRRDTELEEARKAWDNEEEEFNAEAWLEEWEANDDNKQIQIPEPVSDDVDEDIEKEDGSA